MLVFGAKIGIIRIRSVRSEIVVLNTRYPSRNTSYEMLVLIKFKVRRYMRFLSHAETVKVFQRACTRAGVKLRYSHGFNPRPRLSLPLPRSVGVESDDELLSLRVQTLQRADNQSGTTALSFGAEALKTAISAQLPEGFELLSISVTPDFAGVGLSPPGREPKSSFQPRLATYVFALQQEYLDERLKNRIERLLAAEGLVLPRRIDAKGNTRSIDVRPFLKSIKFDDGDIVVECKISSAGSIRVEEILKLLELDVQMLAAPIRRTNVKWHQI